MYHLLRLISTSFYCEGISELDDNDENDDGIEPAHDDKEFMKLLSNEIDKVTQFYHAKVSSYGDTIQYVYIYIYIYIYKEIFHQ